MSEKKPFIGHLPVGRLMTNCYVIGCRETGEAAMIDCGGNAEGLVGMATERDFEITKILQTHAHIDHVAGLHEAVELTGAPIYLHEKDLQLYDAAPQQGMMFGYDIEPLPELEGYLEEGQTVTVGNLEADVLFLPGHSPGHVAFYFEEVDVIFSGDVLFAGSIGRVDLPGSDPEAMKKSLARMTELPDETRVLNGHGPETTIGSEKKRNPFLLQQW